MPHVHRVVLRALAVAAALALMHAPAPAGAQAAAPEDLPLSAVLDSAALLNAVAALDLPQPGLPPLFAVDVDSTGAVKVTPLFRRMRVAYAGPVLQAIRANLRPQPAPARGGFTYVRVVAGAHPRVDHPPLDERQPALRDVRALARGVARVGAVNLDALRALGRPRVEVTLRFRVRDDGRIDTASVLIDRGSGSAAFDAGVLALLPRARFRPAAIEGVPVPVWVKLPLGYTLP